ncbi:MAG: L-threonylcarbamoyladenylate synthase [Pseudomonadota bacterium]
MRATVFTLHASAPEKRKLQKVVEIIRRGGVVLYPSDTGFALGCELSNKGAIQRIRAIRRLDESKLLTFLCASLSRLSEFALVENDAYKIVRRLVPGPFTFVLNATKNVPRYAQDPKRRTSGIRVPDDSISQLLLEQLEAPLISITAKDAEGRYIDDPDDLVESFAGQVDAAITLDRYSFVGESTVIDLTGSAPQILRRGAGFDRVSEFIELALDSVA